MSDEIEALSLPPARAIAFFDGKVNLPTQRWTDVWKAAHDRAFMVAGVQAEDVLAGVRGAIAKALREGTTLAEFRRDLAPLMQRLGWASRGKAYLGWRTRLVYETNLRSAYAAGAYEQATDPDVVAALPFWRYRHSGARDPRPEHQAWDGTVLRHDDPWWRTHHPPNGWGCGCWVEPLSPEDMGRLGKAGADQAPPVVTRPWTDPASGRTEQVPLGIDPGWDYNVGAAWRQASDLPDAPQRPPAGWVPEAPPAPEAPSAPPGSRAPRRPRPAPLPPFEPRSWASLREADRDLTQAYTQWAEGLSEPERVALRRYKGSAYTVMNAWLREPEKTPVTRDLKRNVSALAGALRRAAAVADMVVHRGVGAEEWAAWSARPVGRQLKAAAFVSTSIDLSVAEGFRRTGGGMLEIRLRRGYGGVAYVNRTPEESLTEYELVIAPGARFKVISKEAGRIVVEVAGERLRRPE
jgi:hypothetical protein